MFGSTASTSGEPVPKQFPTGTVSFLFTDIEGSTRLWQEHREAMPSVLALHDQLIGQSVGEHGGVVIKKVGDAIQAAFSRAGDALAAAVAAQRGLLGQSWEEIGSLRVRMAIHSGEAELRDRDYVGHTLNRVARVLSAGHGGQILVSQAAQELVRDHLPESVELRDLGAHRLKDLKLPEHLWQVVASGLPHDFAPLVTLDSRPTNLPPQPTLFIGREAEVAAIRDLVRQEDVRLVTLTGPGGTGKTRLAVEVAAGLMDRFPHGVFFIALASITDPERVPAAIATAVGVRHMGEQPLIQLLEEFLGEGSVLLVLDNFEHLVDAGPLVAELLAACPHLEILITSRMALHLSGEHEYPVPPLAVPAASQDALRDDVDLETLMRSEAVALFVDRARSVRPDFRLTVDNADAVVEITRRLDGLPLALELAAARVRLFPPEALLRRLDHRLRVLTGGARDLPARQKTLQAAIDWSYQLLPQDQRTLFARLSIFPGSCDLAAVEDICGPGDPPLDVLTGIEALIDQNLVRQNEGAEGEPRIDMLQTLREYAAERLDERGEQHALRERHALYYARLVAAREVPFVGAPELSRLQVYDEDRENIRAAFAWCRSHRRDMAILIGRVLWMYWFMRGDMGELSSWFDDVQTHGSELPDEQRASTLTVAALAADALSDPRADAWFDAGVAVRRELGDESSRGDALQRSGWRALQAGRPEQAVPLLDESQAAYATLGHDDRAGWSRYLLAASEEAVGNYARVEDIARAGLAAALEREDAHDEARWTWLLGRQALLRTDATAARSHLQRSLEIRERLADQYCSSESRLSLAGLALLVGNLDQARTIATDNLQLTRRLNHRERMAWHHALLGAVALFGGELDTPRHAFREGLRLTLQLPYPAARWYLLAEHAWGVAGLAALSGDALRAARLGGAATALFRAAGRQPSPSEQARYDRYLEPLRDKTRDPTWIEAWAAGERVAPEDIGAEVSTALSAQ